MAINSNKICFLEEASDPDPKISQDLFMMPYSISSYKQKKPVRGSSNKRFLRHHVTYS